VYKEGVTVGGGLPLGVRLESASPGEVTLAEATLAEVKVPRPKGRPRSKPKRVIADRAYDSDPLRERLAKKGIDLIVPYRQNNKKRRYELKIGKAHMSLRSVFVTMVASSLVLAVGCGGSGGGSTSPTPTVDQYDPLRAFATLGFTDRRAPFFAGAKLPSRNVSSHFSRPSPSSAPSNAHHASSHTLCSPHSFSRRQQVAGDGYLSGKNLHAAPVCNTHRMPSRQARLEAHGRPRLSLRRFGSGSSGPINSHCASLSNSNRFLPMQEVHQTNHLTQKSPA